jgi:hypothetical protein
MPLTHRAKYAMLVQSTVALAVPSSSPAPSTRSSSRRLGNARHAGTVSAAA